MTVKVDYTGCDLSLNNFFNAVNVPFVFCNSVYAFSPIPRCDIFVVNIVDIQKIYPTCIVFFLLRIVDDKYVFQIPCCIHALDFYLSYRIPCIHDAFTIVFDECG